MNSMGISPLNPGDYLRGDEVRSGSLKVVDDGRDWSAWLVWSMNARRRISECLFSLPPARPLVANPVVKKKRTRKSRKPLSLFTDQLMS